MSVALSWFLVVPVLFTLLAWSAAALVYTTAPRREANRVLALILFFEGSSLGVGIGLQALFEEGSPEQFAAAVVTGVGFFGTTLLYPAFLGLALDTPLVRPFRARAGRYALYAATLAAMVAVITGDVWRIPSLPPAVVLLVTLFGLAASFSAWRRARSGTLARRRAGAFLLAFGTRDSGMLLYIAIYSIFAFGLGVEPDPRLLYYEIAVFVGASYLLLAYGIVRSDLLDVDVKVRWTIRRGTVVAMFLAVFLVAFAVVEQWLQRYGVLAGGVAVGLLLFAIRPIERAAERVANAAVPGAKAARDLSDDEREALYRDQLRAAWADGSLSKDERAMLERLRAKLGIADDEAARLEREVVAE